MKRKEKRGAWGTLDPEFDTVENLDDGYERLVFVFPQDADRQGMSVQYVARRRRVPGREAAEPRLPDAPPPGWADPTAYRPSPRRTKP
jgi:hypothetical protein